MKRLALLAALLLAGPAQAASTATYVTQSMSGLTAAPAFTAANWSAKGLFTGDFDIPADTGKGQLTLFLEGWETNGVSATITVTDRDTNAVLDTRTISSAAGAAYGVWNVTGKIRVSVKDTATSGQAVITGSLKHGPKPSGPLGTTASFQSADLTTLGNWVGAYGADGYVLPGPTSTDIVKKPAYATVSLSGNTWYIYRETSTSTSVLQKPDDPTTRRLTTWYTTAPATSGMIVDVNATNGTPHPVSMYFLHADSAWGPLSQVVKVIDVATGAVIDTQTISADAMNNGVYMTWNVSGHVKFDINGYDSAGTALGAILNGVFLGGSSVAPTVNFTAFPQNIVAGQKPEPFLYWENGGASACTSPDFDATAGTRVKVSPTATKTYSITCTNAMGSVTKQATINVMNIPSTTKGTAWIKAYFAGKPVLTGAYIGQVEMLAPAIMQSASCKNSYYCINAGSDWGFATDKRLAFVDTNFGPQQVNGQYGAALMCWGGENKTGDHLFDVYLSNVHLDPAWPAWKDYNTTNMDAATFDCGFQDGHLYVKDVWVTGWADAALDVKMGAIQADHLTTNGNGLNTLKLWWKGPHYFVNSDINNTRYKSTTNPSAPDSPAAGDGGMIYFAQCQGTIVNLYGSKFNGYTTLGRNQYSCGDGADKSVTVNNLTTDPRTTGEMHPLF